MKRRWKVGFGVLLIALAGAGGAYLYYREFEPDRARYPIRGIDVSHHQRTIDWPKVAADDVAFAYIKLSEGGDHRDRQFLRNVAEAKKVGLSIGAYHFFTFCRPGADQAKNFLDALPKDATDLPPVADLEFHGNCPRRPSKEEMGKEVAAFVDMVESRYGRPVMYYVTADFLEAYGDAIPPRRHWTRSILREPDHDNWVIWQYNDIGRVAGIEGNVDLNVLAGQLDGLTRPGEGVATN